MNNPPPSSIRDSFPEFMPHRMLRSAHAQTVIAGFFSGTPPRAGETIHHVDLSDGDQIVLHDDRPANWQPCDPVVLFLHGLGGSHASPYIVRAGAKMNARGYRTFRMDYRQCGEGTTLAKQPYHAGLIGDVQAALREVDRLCPDSPMGLVGYSMGGNLCLKTVGADPFVLPPQLLRAVAINPAIDLSVCCQSLTTPLKRMYDRYFARRLAKQVTAFADIFTHHAKDFSHRPPDTIREFDTRFTVPVWGFSSVEDYYEHSSAYKDLHNIQIPTLILHSRDDPLIPADIFELLNLPAHVELHLSDHGGHLGYIGRKGVDPDRWWMDWRTIDWFQALWTARSLPEISSPDAMTSPTRSAALQEFSSQPR
ncbi:YheT family hydrolase [Calycomorphotria hydatis]|nr:alpha/beta fold hydrolase [Calycomorphotria hydatis]